MRQGTEPGGRAGPAGTEAARPHAVRRGSQHFCKDREVTLCTEPGGEGAKGQFPGHCKRGSSPRGPGGRAGRPVETEHGLREWGQLAPRWVIDRLTREERDKEHPSSSVSAGKRCDWVSTSPQVSVRGV